MLRRSFATGLAALSLAALPTGARAAGYPERPIQLIVPWGAGGGTDAVARVMATLLEKDLGQPVNVINRTGGSGVVGHTAIASARPDGYTIGLITVEIAMMHHQGLTKLGPADYTPLAVINADPGGVMVSASSPYKTAADLLAAIKQKPPGAFKASGTGQGGIWHLGLAGWLLSEGVAADKVTWVPSQGAAPGLTDMVAGGVDIVTASLAEGRALIEAGKVRALASMSPERQGLFPDVPTLKQATGSSWTVAAWRALAGPKGLKPDATQTLRQAVDKAYHSAEYQKFLKDRGFGALYEPGPQAEAFMAQADASLGKVMGEAGLAK